MENYSWLMKTLEGKIIIGPSDTIDSIYSSLENRNIIRRIKKRENEKPFILLCSSINMLLEYIDDSISKDSIKKKLSNVQSPTTFIYATGAKLIKDYKWEWPTVAIRIPKNKDLCAVIEEIKTPIISTSFNSFSKSYAKVVEGEEVKINNINVLFFGVQKLGIINSPSKIISILDNKIIR